MKVKVTRKQVVKAFGANCVIPVGFCDYAYLFDCAEANYYTCGVYGWDADIYDFGTFAIARGYRPFGKATNKYLYLIMRHYDNLLKHAARRGTIEEEYSRIFLRCWRVLRIYLMHRVN